MVLWEDACYLLRVVSLWCFRAWGTRCKEYG